MQERRLAAVMFTDIVGYTKLMGSDEDCAFETLRKNREIHSILIEKFRGTLKKEMGDGMLVSFQLASEAVRCAVEIQKKCKEQNIPLKIGIHEGEMVFEGNDVLGNGVNIASRLQDDTEAGCITISAAVYTDIRNKQDLHTEFIEEKLFKNVNDLLKIYNVCYDQAAIKKISRPPKKNNEGPSIAVLPFVNMSKDEEQEYFCDGITEEIINALTHIENLKVIARTSSFMFKGKHEDMREIGKQLNVNILLEGSVRKAGNRLRITAQLIKVSDGSHLWSERYDRELKDVFEIQDEISMAIVDNLKIKIFDKERKKVLKGKTENLDAYNLYLKGRHQWNKRTKKGLEKSIEFFEQAIKTDPEFALAFVGLADAYIILLDWGYLPPKDAYTKAKYNISKSLEIDDSLGEAYVSLAYLNGLYEWNWKEAEFNFGKGFEISPNYPTAHQWYAIYLIAVGRSREAMEQIHRAKELDPLSLVINFTNGWILYLANRFSEAINQFEKSLAINKNLNVVKGLLFQIWLHDNKEEEIVRACQNILSTDPANHKYIPVVDDIYSKSGIEGLLNWVIDEVSLVNPSIYSHPYYLSVYYAALNKKEKALDWIERGLELRSMWLFHFIKLEPWYDNLRNHPRFIKVMDKMGLS